MVPTGARLVHQTISSLTLISTSQFAQRLCGHTTCVWANWCKFHARAASHVSARNVAIAPERLAELNARIHRDNSGLRGFFSRAPSTAGERIEPRDESILVPFHALEMQSDQIAHRELAVAGCIDHILEARGFNEEVLAVREHLVMNERMLSPEVFAKVIEGTTNLRQLDLVLTAQRVQDMRFREIAERQSRTCRIGEFDNRLGSAASAGPQRYDRPDTQERTVFSGI